MDSIIALERARGFLEAGDAVRALNALASSPFPPVLQPEADFVAAEAWRSRGFFGKAERLYRRVLAENPDADPVLWLDAALGSAAGHRSLGAVRPARELLRRARELARRHQLESYVPRIGLESVLVDRAAGLYAKSISRLSIMLRRSLREKEWAEAAFLLWAMGGARRFKGDLAASKSDFERSLTLARKADDPSGEGYALFGLGGITRIMGRLKDSASYYQRAQKLFDRTQDMFGQAYAQCGYANALRQLGRWSEALSHYRRSHALYSRLGDEVDLAYVEWGIGQVHLHLGEPRPAAQRFQKALRMFARHDEQRGASLSEMSLAQALHAIGRTAEAEGYFDRSHRRSRRHGLHAHLEIYT